MSCARDESDAGRLQKGIYEVSSKQRRVFFRLWVLFLLAVIAAGGMAYAEQCAQGLSITGLSRNASWGLYVGQFTFVVGVAASSVVILLPRYFYGARELAPLLLLGECLAVAALTTALLFIIADMGRPERLLYMLRHPSPSSMLFWDMVVLTSYLALTLCAGWATMRYEIRAVEAPKNLRRFMGLLCVMSVSIHTATAFLFTGLPGRSVWLNPLVTPRFLASAFCSGPALLLLLAFVLQRGGVFHVSDAAVRRVTHTITYALAASLFFFGLECFSALYSQYPGFFSPLVLIASFKSGGFRENWLALSMWGAVSFAVIALGLLIMTHARAASRVRTVALVMTLFAVWLDKGVVFVTSGFIVDMLGALVPYVPTGPELLICAAIYAIGMLLFSCLWKLLPTLPHSVNRP